MTVTLVQKYNREWPELFETIKAFLGERIRRMCLRIEHVGSTSIPGMTAKPIIDLILVINSQNFEEIKSLMAKRGYYHEGDKGIKERQAFDLMDVSAKSSIPDHHLYVCPEHNNEMKNEIAFREFLKRNKDYAERLSKLKWSLAEEFDNDRSSYMEGKAALCREITRMALKSSHENSADTLG